MLTILTCHANQLTGLDVRELNALISLSCGVNKMDAAALNALFGTLNSTSVPDVKIIYIGSNPGTNDCNRSIATNKGWEVMQ